MHEAVEVGEEGKDIGEAHLPTPPTTIVDPSSRSFFEVIHIGAFLCSSKNLLLRHYVQYPLKESINSQLLVEIPASNQLNTKTYPFFENLQPQPLDLNHFITKC